MSVMIEMSLGTVVVDLYVKDCPNTCNNFLKLCKLKYYNNNLIYSVEKDFVCRSGDPTATGQGGNSAIGIFRKQRLLLKDEIHNHIRHTKRGVIGMVKQDGENGFTSLFYLTLRENIEFLDEKFTVFGVVVEDEDKVLSKINELYTDDSFRPYIDTRIKHTFVLDDPFPDPDGFPEDPPKSPSENERPAQEKVEKRMTHGEKIDESRQ